MEATNRLKDELKSARDGLADLAGEIGTLVRQEVELATAEVCEKARDAKGGAARFGIGSAVLHAGALAIAAMAVLGLMLLIRGENMSTLAAAFVSSAIVGVLFAVIGFALASSGAKDLSPANFVPRRTIDCFKQQARWAREKVA